MSTATSSDTATGSGRIVLGENNYGKGEVKLLKVFKGPDGHEVRDIRADIALEGEFGAAHLEGDNTGLLATDTMRNTVYALAPEHFTADLESFGLALVNRFVAAGPSVTRARVRLTEYPYERLTAGGRAHPYGFQRGSGGNRVAVVTGTAEGATVRGGDRGPARPQVDGLGLGGLPARGVHDAARYVGPHHGHRRHAPRGPTRRAPATSTGCSPACATRSSTSSTTTSARPCSTRST